jgi:hypothetical protein
MALAMAAQAQSDPATMDSYREVFDRRLQTRFNAKVLTLRPFGPQLIYCKAPIRTLDDLQGFLVPGSPSGEGAGKPGLRPRPARMASIAFSKR